MEENVEANVEANAAVQKELQEMRTLLTEQQEKIAMLEKAHPSNLVSRILHVFNTFPALKTC